MENLLLPLFLITLLLLFLSIMKKGHRHPHHHEPEKEIDSINTGVPYDRDKIILQGRINHNRTMEQYCLTYGHTVKPNGICGNCGKKLNGNSDPASCTSCGGEICTSECNYQKGYRYLNDVVNNDHN